MKMSVEHPPSSPPPPPPPLPPPAPLPAPCPPSSAKKKLYQTIASSRSAVEGDHTEARLLLSQRESSFRPDLQWILVNTYVPSLIQDGPQCGLVALWMAACLRQPQLTVDMETVVHTALSRGYTAQGEMFSARNMALLAEEVCGCKAELLSGGLNGNNAAAIITHLWGRQPVLIPYDEDYNHEPCQRSGHRAHWAVASVLYRFWGLGQEFAGQKNTVMTWSLNQVLVLLAVWAGANKVLLENEISISRKLVSRGKHEVL
ncbi:actin maturation protease isoform 2-T2 [Pholidichthys leucotaenia]